MTDAGPSCPRCAAALAPGQEYCLSCGLRLPAAGRLAGPGDARRSVRGHVVALGLVAVAGAALAIGLTRDATATTEVVTATGGRVAVAQPTRQATRLVAWPNGRDAWTIVLVSVPKVDGRDEAVAIADEARRAGLRPTGVLDSSRYPSLRPGYWVAYQGVFASEAEANSALRAARRIVRTARVDRVAG